MGSIPIFTQIHGFDSHFYTNSWVRFPVLKLVIGSIPIFKHFPSPTHFKVTITTLRVRFPPFKDKQKVNNRNLLFKGFSKFRKQNCYTNCKKKYTYRQICDFIFFSRP